MRILVATDAWRPQVNGVVRTLENLAAEVGRLGSEIAFMTPAEFRTFPLPTYPEISLALAWPTSARRKLDAGAFDHVHIATEGPIGWSVRHACRSTGRPFTTSFHTRFPEYVSARLPVPESLTYGVLRRFHAKSAGVMVATQSLEDELASRGFSKLMRWSRGVDAERFHPEKATPLDLPRPVFMYAGRIAPEKNLKAFLSLDLPGSKLIAGDGPERADLQANHPQAHFVGMKSPDDLARLYASADVFVFPSRTDTFGLVNLEALACGLPVAAFPVPGPRDVLGDSGAGVLDEDLRAACMMALSIPRQAARQRALKFSWRASAEQFLANVRAARGEAFRQRHSF
jgi:glycosyltransferase involved in cell wall biosynthesis